MNAAFEVLNFRDGEGGVGVAKAGGALPDVDESVLVAIDERLQEHATHERKDGGVGADAKGEREDNDRREPPGAAERVEGDSQVPKK